jgi:hypothetical protein
VLWRCLNCPKHPVPIPERGIDKNAPITIVHFKVQFIKCSRHGVLTLNANNALCVRIKRQTRSWVKFWQERNSHCWVLQLAI